MAAAETAVVDLLLLAREKPGEAPDSCFKSWSDVTCKCHSRLLKLYTMLLSRVRRIQVAR